MVATAKKPRRATARSKSTAMKEESTGNLPARIETRQVVADADLSVITQDGIAAVLNLFEREKAAHSGRIGFLDAVFRLYQKVEFDPTSWDQFEVEFVRMQQEHGQRQSPSNSSQWNKIILYLLVKAYEASGDPDSQERRATREKVTQVINMRSWYAYACRAILYRLKQENNGGVPPYQPGLIKRIITKGLKLPEGGWEFGVSANGEGRGTITRLAEEGRYMNDKGEIVRGDDDYWIDDEAEPEARQIAATKPPPRRKLIRKSPKEKASQQRAALGFTEEPDGKPSSLRPAPASPEPVRAAAKDYHVERVSEGWQRSTLWDLMKRATHMFADNEAVLEVSITLRRTEENRITLFINGDAAEFKPWPGDFLGSILDDRSMHLILTPDNQIKLARDAEVLIEDEVSDTDA